MSTASDTSAPIPTDPDLKELLTRIPVAIALLDEQRQVVFGQDRLLELVGADTPIREDSCAPGDFLGCVNARESERGCGSHDACQLCGAFSAIAQSQMRQATVSRECRIRYESKREAGDLDLSVTATPYVSGGRRFTLLTVQDTSHEKRRRALERVFFHDITNLAGGLAGLAGVLRAAQSGDDVQQLLTIMERSARSLIDEIEAQRQLASAESGELHVSPGDTNGLDVLRDVADTLRYHNVAEGRSIVVDERATACALTVDSTLLRRVLINLTKNALEATPPGERVTLSVAAYGTTTRFTVHNVGAMPSAVQQQLFQRSFSTKGSGRGLGSYSVRMITEQYLRGSVSFTSAEPDGTLFCISIPTTLG